MERVTETVVASACEGDDLRVTATIEITGDIYYLMRFKPGSSYGEGERMVCKWQWGARRILPHLQAQ